MSSEKYRQWLIGLMIVLVFGIAIGLAVLVFALRLYENPGEKFRAFGSGLIEGYQMTLPKADAGEPMSFNEMKFVQTRIPPLDALTAFVPTGQEQNDVLKHASETFGPSRWFPQDGGHKVIYLYEGGAFDETFFTLEKGAWDHEHCEECGCSIPSMTLCWVTEFGPFVILCEACYEKLDAEKEESSAVEIE